jgi:hypothetical protein
VRVGIDGLKWRPRDFRCRAWLILCNVSSSQVFFLRRVYSMCKIGSSLEFAERALHSARDCSGNSDSLHAKVLLSRVPYFILLVYLILASKSFTVDQKRWQVYRLLPPRLAVPVYLRQQSRQPKDLPHVVQGAILLVAQCTLFVLLFSLP